MNCLDGHRHLPRASESNSFWCNLPASPRHNSQHNPSKRQEAQMATRKPPTVRHAIDFPSNTGPTTSHPFHPLSHNPLHPSLMCWQSVPSNYRQNLPISKIAILLPNHLHGMTGDNQGPVLARLAAPVQAYSLQVEHTEFDTGHVFSHIFRCCNSVGFFAQNHDLKQGNVLFPSSAKPL